MGVANQTTIIRGGVASTPKITNLSIPVLNTEVSHLFDSGTKKIQVRIRGLAKAQFSFISTQSSTKFITVRAGTVYSEDGLNLVGVTMFIQTDKNTQIAEILEWK